MSKVRDQTFQIVRYADAPTLAETACMTFAPFADDVARLSQRAVAAGLDQGEHLRVLISMPGFSLTHVWFKKHYPLPLHSHDADCLYYIIAGSLRIGNETLGPRDGFFIPADMPYAYIPGDDGVELLEFRHSTHFTFVNHANGSAFWNKAIQTAQANAEDWRSAKRPVLSDGDGNGNKNGKGNGNGKAANRKGTKTGNGE